jgi:hypothetical protein
VVKASPLQSRIGCVCLYPYLTVIEMQEAAIAELRAPKHGTRWEPLLK